MRSGVQGRAIDPAGGGETHNTNTPLYSGVEQSVR